MGELPPDDEQWTTPEQLAEIEMLYAAINYNRRQTPMDPADPKCKVKVYNGVDPEGRVHTTSLEFVPCNDTDGGSLLALGVVSRADTRVVEMYLCDTAQVVHWRSNTDVRSGYQSAAGMIQGMNGIIDAMDTMPGVVEVDGHMGRGQRL